MKLYKIIAETRKNYKSPYEDKVFVRNKYNLSVLIEAAQSFPSFEAAQPAVQALRELYPNMYIYAIPAY